MKFSTKIRYLFRCLICPANSLLLVFVLIIIPWCSGVKLKFATETDCERYSMDSLYHEKFRILTDDIFGDSEEFVSRACDLIVDSLTTLMAQLPGSDSSGTAERKVYTAWRELNRQFSKSLDKMKKNITDAWEVLLEANLNMLLDKPDSNLQDFKNKTIALADSYKQARIELDSRLKSVILPIKNVVVNGLKGLTHAAEEELQKKAKNESTSSESDEKSKTSDEQKKGDEEESLKNVGDDVLKLSLMNITKNVVPSFLGTITLLVIERDMKLDAETAKDGSETKDSVFDDICFSFIMIQSRTSSVIHDDLPNNKEGRDLARRNLYMYWYELAAEMFKEKIKNGNRLSSSTEGKQKYKKLWENEDTLADTLVTLMDIY